MSKVMTLSKYSIINLTNYLETTIKKMDTSDNEFLYIESYIDSDGIRRVKLKTDSGISSVTTTYNKEKGDVLESCVKVNLYAFYKVIKYADDLINLEIYDDKLIVSSYYSEYDEYDQLEVELTISEKYSYTETGISMPVDVKTFTLSVLQRHYISSHLDITEDIENLNISRKSGVLYFTTYKNGVSTTLRVKDIEVDTELDDFSFDIHSYFIRLVFNVDAFSVYTKGDELLIKIEDGAVVKFITYNHSEYIKDAPKTWKVF
jgi:hypothetical protein